MSFQFQRRDASRWVSAGPAQAKRGLSLFKNFSWTLVGNVVYAVCQWTMLSAIAKLGNPEMVGQYSLGLAVTAPIMLFCNLQLRSIQATDAQQKYEFKHYLSLRGITTVLALGAIVAAALSGNYRRDTTVVILLVGMAKAIESMSDIYYGLLQKHEQMDRIAKSLIMRGILSMSAMTAGVYVTGSIAWGAAALAMTWLVTLYSYDMRSPLQVTHYHSGQQVPPAGNLRDNGQVLLRLVWLALPLGFVIMFLSLNSGIPRYFIQGALGERELGIFSSLAYAITAGGTVVGALGQSATPRLGKYYSSGQYPAFIRLLLKLVGLAVLLGAVGLMAVQVMGRQILTLLYTLEYAEYTDVFLILMVSAGVGYVGSILGYGMTAAGRFRAQIPLFGIATAVTLWLCWWLIPSEGLRGAAVAVLVSQGVQVLGGLLIVVHSLRTRRGGSSCC